MRRRADGRFRDLCMVNRLEGVDEHTWWPRIRLTGSFVNRTVIGVVAEVIEHQYLVHVGAGTLRDLSHRAD